MSFRYHRRICNDAGTCPMGAQVELQAPCDHAIPHKLSKACMNRGGCSFDGEGVFGEGVCMIMVQPWELTKLGVVDRELMPVLTRDGKKKSRIFFLGDKK